MTIPAANPNLATADQLRAWLGYDQDARVLRWLRERRIPFDYGKDGRPVTTIHAINQHLAAASNDGDEEIRFRGAQKKAG